MCTHLQSRYQTQAQKKKVTMYIMMVKKIAFASGTLITDVKKSARVGRSSLVAR